MLRRGAQLGQYKIVRFLGEGGMGEVYEALHVELNKRVALKTLRPGVENGPSVRERFLREGRAAARLRHPHIVDVYDAGQEEGAAFLVMELLEGEDLAALLKREKKLSPERAVDVLLPVMAAVSNVHDQGIIHRDLKPQNIFLARGPYGEPQPKVLDFGISKLTTMDASLTSAGEALGSPFYMSPEQARGVAEVDHRTDQFSLGVIVYEAVSAARPFEAPNLMALLFAIQNTPPVPLLGREPALPADFGAVVMKALERDPAARYPSVHELGRALLPFAGERSRMLWGPLFGQPKPEPVVEPQEGPATDRPGPGASGSPPALKHAPAETPLPAIDEETRRPVGSFNRRPITPAQPQPSLARAVPPVVQPPRPAPARPAPNVQPRRPTSSAQRAVSAPPPPPIGRQETPPLPRRDTPPMPSPRVERAAPVRRSTSPAVEKPRLRSAAPEAPAPSGSTVVLKISDANAVEVARTWIEESPRLLMLCDAKGETPEKRVPLVHVLASTNGLIDVVIIADESGSGWRDPMGELCKQYAPDRYDAKSSYLFFERGALVSSLRKDLWNPLADAEKITDFLAAKVPGTQRYKRPKDD